MRLICVLKILQQATVTTTAAELNNNNTQINLAFRHNLLLFIVVIIFTNLKRAQLMRDKNGKIKYCVHMARLWHSESEDGFVCIVHFIML